MNNTARFFTHALLNWFDTNGRKNLPWQHPKTPYTVWVSEIMLQQTQVKTVIPYFLKFMKSFPDVISLARATEDEILALWSGLGYYSRGRNLHKTAQIVAETYHGVFPGDVKTLVTLPGIGESTAAAIVSLAFQKPAAILDGNVKRILSRYFLIEGNPQKAAIKRLFIKFAERCVSHDKPSQYTQAIMDLGAMICTPKKPSCNICPVSNQCLAFKNQCTESYPEKIKKKPLPTKEAQFIILWDAASASIYLEKQPENGIWGGLWSLPQLAKEQCVIQYTENTHALAVSESRPSAYLKHTFTHFRLILYPQIVHVHKNNASAKLTADKKWVPISEIMSLGLAKPIREIISHFLHKDGVLLL